MEQLKKVDAGVWVDVNDRTQPMPNDNTVIIKFEDGNTCSSDDESLPYSVATHWLKTLTQVFVISEHELRKVICEAAYQYSVSKKSEMEIYQSIAK